MCDKNCETCFGAAKNCTTCSKNLALIGNTCKEIKQFYGNNSIPNEHF